MYFLENSIIANTELLCVGCIWHIMHLTILTMQPLCEAGTIINPIQKMMQLRIREVKKPSQSHIATKARI